MHQNEEANPAFKKELGFFYKKSFELLIRDRIRIQKLIKKLPKMDEKERPIHFQGLKETFKKANERFTRRKNKLPVPSFDDKLPITAYGEEIIQAIKNHPVLVIAGETGSGKTTQLPKLCLHAGRGLYGRIACTQPRRIAATSVAERIAEELRENLGKTVGCKVRFRDQTGEDTVIKLMTDGILLAETLSDPHLNQYDTIIIDEAHERSLNIDFLLGFLVRLLKKRKDLKLIITSATIDTEKFSEAFNHAPVIQVSGRMYPVEVRYEPQELEEEEEKAPSLAESILPAVEGLIQEDPFGDILVFLPTEQDIREGMELLQARDTKGAVILPLYARLRAMDQKRVFQPASGRKIILATNVAETSLTIPGIRYVVDTGLARIPRYIPGLRSTSLPVLPISKSSADQRKGRCGRVEGGICIRLYSEESYEKRERFTTPEILRANLADVLLKMTALRLGDIRDFPFVDRPADRLIKDGYEVLQELGAIRPKKVGQKGETPFELTQEGRQMAAIPLDPRIARMVVAARELGCVKDIAVIAAGITAGDPRERPEDKKTQAQQAQKIFFDPASDFLSLLLIWQHFETMSEGKFATSRLKKFAASHYLSFKRLREWRDLFFQIIEIFEESDTVMEERDWSAEKPDRSQAFSPRYEAIHKAILSGYLSNIARKKEKSIMIAAKNREVMIFPGSGLFKQAPDWLVAAEIVETSRLFARCAAAVDPQWIVAMAGELVSETLYDPHWEKKMGRVMALRRRSLYGLILTDRESVPFGKNDPETATAIFIRQALVEGDLREIPPFLAHNRELVREVMHTEDILRKRDLFAGEEALFDFYAKRIQGIFDIRTLLSEIRKKKDDSWLRMEKSDILLREEEKTDEKRFPEKLFFRTGPPFSLQYAFEPGEDGDGLTLLVPKNRAAEINPVDLEWLVPGLFPEKIETLLKGLPKVLRKRLLPLQDTARDLAKELKPDGRPLALSLSRLLYRRYNLDVPPSRFEEVILPDHLRMRITLLDERGEPLASSRNPAILMEREYERPVDALFEKAVKNFEKFPVNLDELDSLPKSMDLSPETPGKNLAYPALVIKEEMLGKSLFSSPAEAEEKQGEAMQFLLVGMLEKEMREVKKLLKLHLGDKSLLASFGGKEAFEKLFMEKLLAPFFREPIERRDAFYARREKIEKELYLRAKSLLDAALPVLNAFRENLEHLDALARKGGKLTKAFTETMKIEMAKLVPENFIVLYEKERLPDLPRYLKAITVRAQRAMEDFTKDSKRAMEVLPHEENLRTIIASLSPHVSEEKKRAVEDLFWMIEEFKISVFAQELGTSFPVSAKRLKEQMQKIRSLV